MFNGMKMPSAMKGTHKFSTVPQATIERSQFDRSHSHKTTFNPGYLIPFYADEALPGDTFNLKTNGFIRVSTLWKPLMDNLYVDTFFFFVPNRLIWSNWVKMNGEQTTPGDSTAYTVPLMMTYTPNSGTIGDYMGIPLVGAAIQHSALWHRAYNLIYNQWFRDENLVNPATIHTDDGPDPVGDYGLRKRGKRHDYFTSSLPWPQKGTAVSIPLGTSAPVIPTTTHAQPTFWNVTAGATIGGLAQAANAANTAINKTIAVGNPNDPIGWNAPNLTADLTNATAATINSLRQAFQIQKMLERDARGGTRYIEVVKAHFGVTSPDSRLQRPEYLGGGSAPIMCNPVAQTAQTGLTGGSTPLGNLAGVGTGSFMGHGFVKSFTEHGIILGILNVRADLTYQQGINRMFSRQTRYDYFWPALAHIGEQTVLNKELFADGSANDALAFGYQERYAEYRYKPSLITGQFRSTHPTPLDLWHLSEKFAALPTLAQTFIEDQTTSIMARNVAVPSEPLMYGDFWFNLITARPMPLFSVPGLIDHF